MDSINQCEIEWTFLQYMVEIVHAHWEYDDYFEPYDFTKTLLLALNPDNKGIEMNSEDCLKYSTALKEAMREYVADVRHPEPRGLDTRVAKIRHPRRCR